MPLQPEQEPTQDKYGSDVHPAWGMISGSRVSSSGGIVLFDSEIKHQHFVKISVVRASRKRQLNRDWLHPDNRELVEVWLSEAQWAQFVSSMNSSATPCTIMRTEKDGAMPSIPFEPRLAVSQEEVRTAADRTFEKIKEALAAYEEKKTVGNLRTLKATVANAGANMEFAAQSLTEHAENVTQKARADIEAMFTAAQGRYPELADRVDRPQLEG